MYSKEQLNSKKSVLFYEKVARRVLDDISSIEGLVNKRNDKRYLKVSITNKLFELSDNTISYSDLIASSSDGHYLSIDAMKEIGENGLDITLFAGIKGYDIASGEGYDRKLAKVNYTFEKGKIKIKEAMDENDLETSEKERLKKVFEKVKSMKK